VFPEPYLQPDRNKDCGYYTAAYIARCLGHPDVTAEQVKAWRAETRYHETAYARRVLGAETRTFWDVYGDGPERRIFWMGQGAQDWLRGWLADGWVGHAQVFRIPEMGHAVAVLGVTDEGVLLMDPLSGHITEPWEWFLGIGPGKHGCHFMEGWYR